MRRRNLDLVAAITLAAASIALALLPDRLPFVGTLLALPLVFALPGYTLTQALFRSHAGNSSPNQPGDLILPPRLLTGYSFGAFDHLVFSLGLSLVNDILVGFLLNLLPIGLQWQSWSLTLGLLTLVFALIALIRRLFPSSSRARESHTPARAAQAPPPPINPSPAPTSTGSGRRKHHSFKEVGLLSAALLIAGLALWLAMVRPPQPQPSFTQFWMLPMAQANHSCAVQVGVQSFETAPETYDLQVMSGSTLVFTQSLISLGTQQWNHVVSISNARGSQFVDARLYRLDRPGTVYREVHLTLHEC